MNIRKLVLPAAIAAALVMLAAPAAFAQQDPQADAKKAEEAKKAEDAKKAEAQKKAKADKEQSGDRGVEPEEEGDK